MAYSNRAFSDRSSGLEVASHDYSQQPGLEAISGPHQDAPANLQSPSIHPSSGGLQSPGLESNSSVMGNPNPAQSGYYGQTPHQGYDYMPANPSGPPPPFKSEYNPAPPVAAGSTKRERMCGVKRRLFFILLAILAAIIIAGAVGGGVGGSLAGKNTSSSAGATAASSTTSSSTSATSTSSSTSSPTSTVVATSTPAAVAAVELDDGESIGVFYQDAATSDFYISAFYGKSGQSSNWFDPIKITGLNPKPKANSSFAVVYNLTDTNTVALFYVAENNTMYDAYGTVALPQWTMGHLAPDTKYGVLLADDGGIAANPWMVTNANWFSTRVYYIDRATNAVKELALDYATPWKITSQNFEVAGTGSSMATAWLPADNFTYTSAQVQHLLYLDTTNKLRHYPSYNGIWNGSNAESIASLAAGQPVTATIWIDDPEENNKLRLFWLDNADGRFTSIDCLGASPLANATFVGKGTCGSPIDIQGFSPTVNAGAIKAGPIAAISWQNQVRVYYLSSTETKFLTEVSLTEDGWATEGSTSAGRARRRRGLNFVS